MTARSKGPEHAWTTSVESVSIISTFSPNSDRSTIPHIRGHLAHHPSELGLVAPERIPLCEPAVVFLRHELSDEQEHDGLADGERCKERHPEHGGEERARATA